MKQPSISIPADKLKEAGQFISKNLCPPTASQLKEATRHALNETKEPLFCKSPVLPGQNKSRLSLRQPVQKSPIDTKRTTRVSMRASPTKNEISNASSKQTLPLKKLELNVEAVKNPFVAPNSKGQSNVTNTNTNTSKRGVENDQDFQNDPRIPQWKIKFKSFNIYLDGIEASKQSKLVKEVKRFGAVSSLHFKFHESHFYSECFSIFQQGCDSFHYYKRY